MYSDEILPLTLEFILEHSTDTVHEKGPMDLFDNIYGLPETPQAAQDIVRKMFISDPMVISVPDGYDISDISIKGEGNHRAIWIWTRLVENDLIPPDYTIDTVVRRVDPDALPSFSINRTAGKPEAIYLRWFIDVNASLEYILAKRGLYVTHEGHEVPYDPLDFGLLRSIIGTLKSIEGKEGLSRTPSWFGNLKWSYEDELRQGLGSLIDHIVDHNGEACHLYEASGRFLTEEIQSMFSNAFENHVDHAGLNGILQGREPTKKHQALQMLYGATRREVSGQILEVIEGHRRAAGTLLTYGALMGWHKILEHMTQGAKDAGIEFKDLLLILKGRSYGTDRQSYGPIKAAYERLTKQIGEPDRTKLISRVLDMTDHWPAAKRRKSMWPKINDAYKGLTDTERTSYLEWVLGDASENEIIAYGTLDLGHRRAVMVSRYIGNLMEDEYVDMVPSLEKLGQDISAEVASIHSLSGLREWIEEQDAKSIDELLVEWDAHILHSKSGSAREKQNVWGLPQIFSSRFLKTRAAEKLHLNGVCVVKDDGYFQKDYATLIGMARSTQDFITRRKRQALNVIPDQVYLIEPEGEMVILYRDEPLAVFEAPLALVTNSLVRPYPEDTSAYTGHHEYWLQPLHPTDLYTLHLCNAFEMELDLPEYVQALQTFNAALMPVYRLAREINTSS